ncbi:MAG: HAD-IIB family hydrolase [Gammaproteobacteria bacterium]|nr:HAD-IIB family hydrolase [Gammaproteobacteria bacterium]
MSSPFLLCTDLDRTLLPNGEQPESPLARRTFSQVVTQSGFTLAYVSGRDLKRVVQAIENYCLPQPNYIIADVGAAIYDAPQGEWQFWQRWEQEIHGDWNGHSRDQLSGYLRDIRALRLQEHGKQSTYKLSYYFSLNEDQQALAEQVEQRLTRYGIRHCLVWSIDEPAGIGLLDILPQSANKLHAVEFVQHYLGIGRNRTLFAGDSGNDIQLLASAIPAVLVANAMPVVVEIAVTRANAAGNGDLLYLAHGGFNAMNGNYSAGILEGLAHFYPDTVKDFLL